jgi:hypothetical protein
MEDMASYARYMVNTESTGEWDKRASEKEIGKLVKSVTVKHESRITCCCFDDNI